MDSCKHHLQQFSSGDSIEGSRHVQTQYVALPMESLGFGCQPSLAPHYICGAPAFPESTLAWGEESSPSPSRASDKHLQIAFSSTAGLRWASGSGDLPGLGSGISMLLPNPMSHPEVRASFRIFVSSK